jgi:hypothetical protein
VRVGLPLIMLTVGGWLGIAHVLSGKFELRVRSDLLPHLLMPQHALLLHTAGADGGIIRMPWVCPCQCEA